MTVAVEPNPTVARRQLAVYFNRQREQHNRALDSVAGRLGVAASQASRLASGARGYRPEDVRSLATWYGLDEATERWLLALADESRKRAWWQQVDLRRLLPHVDRHGAGRYVYPRALRHRASRPPPDTGVRSSDDRASDPEMSHDRIRTAVDVRIRRQRILARDPAPELWVVIDEAALARVTGGQVSCETNWSTYWRPEARRTLLFRSSASNTASIPESSATSFLLSMPGELPDVIYTEGL